MSSHAVVGARGFTVRSVYCCNVCGLEVSDEDAIVKHLATDHGDAGPESADHNVSLDQAAVPYQQQDDGVTSSTVLPAKRLRRKSRVLTEQSDSEAAVLRFTKPLVCSDCGQVYKYMGCFKRHIDREHNKSASCTTDAELQRRTGTASQLARDALSSRDCALEQHSSADSSADCLLNTADQLELQQVTDELNEVMTSSVSGNKRPVEHVPKSQMASYCCPECPTWFRSRRSLRIHIIDKHRGWTYVCESCGRLFIDCRRLQSHVVCDHAKVLSDKDDNVHLSQVVLGSHCCGICRCRYRGKEELVKHMACHNDSLPAFTCTVCSAQYLTKSGLRCHTRRVHTHQHTGVQFTL